MSVKVLDPSVDRHLQRLAARQHGVVSRRQLVAAGVPRWCLEHRLSEGRLQRIHRGVYSLGPPASLKQESRWMAAVLAVGRDAVLSHASAAALWNLRNSSAAAVDVAVPRAGGTRRRGDMRVQSSRTLTQDQRTVYRGIPVTTVARTLIDLAGRFDLRTAERALGQAEVLRLFDLPQLEAAIQANPGRRGAAVMRRLVAGYLVGAGLTESELEDEFLRLCERFGIPRPDTQVQLGPDRVDFLWRTEGLVVETDGWRWHGGRSAWESDRRRDIRLQRLGLRVARFSYARVLREPKGVADDLKDLLSAGPSGELRRAG